MTVQQDAIKAAMAIARDIAEGRMPPATLEAEAEAAVRELAGVVVGPGDLAWPAQVDIARQVLAAGGLSVDEQLEWLAVARSRVVAPGRVSGGSWIESVLAALGEPE